MFYRTRNAQPQVCGTQVGTAKETNVDQLVDWQKGTLQLLIIMKSFLQVVRNCCLFEINDIEKFGANLQLFSSLNSPKTIFPDANVIKCLVLSTTQRYSVYC